MPSSRAELRRARHAARLRALEVVIEGRTQIGDDMVVRDLAGRLLRRYVDVRWTTPAAAAMGPKSAAGQRQVDHVVPVNILVDRIIQGASPAAVLEAGAQCYVTKDEHNSNEGLARFRVRHADLRERMQTCELEQLVELGWERYRRSGLTWAANT